MRPTLCRDVFYTRTTETTGVPGRGDPTVKREQYAAKITRVEWAGNGEPPSGDQPIAESEHDYRVWLTVFLHTPGRDEVWMTPVPVRFDMDGSANTWRWPPRI